MSRLRHRRYLDEVAYDGNLGFHEMMLFYQKATKEQERKMERFLERGLWNKVYELLKLVTGIALKR